MHTQYDNVSLPMLFLIWARYALSKKLQAMKPAVTANEIARQTALTGNPPGA